MKNKTIRLIALGVFAGVLLIGLTVASLVRREPVRVDSGFRVVMGTFSRIVVLTPSETVARKCIAAAFLQQRCVDELMSDYREDSELSRVNRQAFAEPVQVSEETFAVLEKAKEYSALSGGAFDVTIGPLGDLWRAAGDANVPPTEAQIAEARSRVGYEKLLLDPQARTVRFAVEGMRVDLGGIAKGYAIDLSVQAMKQHGAVGGMVDIGGDVMCFGTPPKGKATWVVGLQDPTVAPDDLTSNTLLLSLKVTDAAVATSGDYRRFIEIQGQKQSHIMDRQSGKSANELVSVTIVAPDALSADALATAVTVLGLEKGLALIEQLPDAEAILIPHADKVEPVFTTGAQAHIR
ncbi:MAG: FAD:protein FMN transferase [Phycisphaerales bacterium]|nr:MAG: FAD:protein FMN transferase [Phycisphaerales bacterium]